MNANKDRLSAFIGTWLAITIVGAIIYSIVVLTPPPKTDAQWEAERQAHNKQIEDQLPGCVIQTFKDYRGVDKLVVVRCDGRATQSSSYMIWRGKYYESGATVVVQ